ncbi:PRM1A protein, partial [Hylia prasina]|nr:PRM1A protein [Hylia prasina]
MELGNISKPTYRSDLEAPGCSTPGLVTMAHGFLGLVQPNPLPIELINFGQSQSEFREDIHKLLLYELGFLICAAIGVLFIILVPLVGCCFCCCRC